MDESRTGQSNLRIFQHCYKICCKSENLIPLKALIAKKSARILDFCVDRIKYIDWAPIFIALSDDLNLQCIAIRCRVNVKTVLEHVDSERLARNVTKSVILTKFMLNNLTDAVAQCVTQNAELTLLQLEGIPLYIPYIAPISEALKVNDSLTHVSLQSCLLGDLGCLKVCQALRCHSKVIILNISNCEITSQGATYIADLIKYQKIYRYSENWKQTLRYRSPDLDSMSGLRRITLCGNPSIGDNGFLSIVETLLDDLWIKGIDVQQCGLTEISIKHSIRLLEFNTTLHILDLRQNTQISGKLLATISVALRRNENNSAGEKQWFAISNSINNAGLKNDLTNTLEKKKPVPKKESAIHEYVNKSYKSKYEYAHNSKEMMYSNVLREQLKEEATARKQLEDLNERLLQQVKELKQQQMQFWKLNVPSCEEPKAFIKLTNIKKSHSSHVNISEERNNSLNKLSKSTCMIHQKGKNEAAYNEKRIEDPIESGIGDSPKVSNPANKFAVSQDAQIYGDVNMEEFKNKICTGADILEALLVKRSGLKCDREGSVSGFTSDSSETVIYSNSDSDITLQRQGSKYKMFYSSDDNISEEN